MNENTDYYLNYLDLANELKKQPVKEIALKLEQMNRGQDLTRINKPIARINERFPIGYNIVYELYGELPDKTFLVKTNHDFIDGILMSQIAKCQEPQKITQLDIQMCALIIELLSQQRPY
jgi:hypothetical protein